MANEPSKLLVQYLRKVVDPQGTGGLTDGQLLDRYATGRDEAAFELLVWRHGSLVLAACRRVLGNAQDAEDAFQATFLALSRRAGAIRQRESVGGWLYRVAYRTALRLRKRATQRSCQSLDADWPEPNAAGAEQWSDLRPVLDDEVNRLPDKYRTPFVLCCLEGQTNEQAARQLGCPKGTILSRLSRARALLRGRLTRRGVTLSMAALGLALARQATASVPARLVQTTVQGVKLITLGKATAAGALTPPIVALTEGVLQAMWMTNCLKIAGAVVAVVGLLSGGAGLVSSTASADKPQASKSPDSTTIGKDKSQSAQESKNQPEKGKKEQAPTVQGVVEKLEGDQITVTVQTNPGKKVTENKTYAVAKDVKVILQESFDKSQPPPAGKISDITPGTQVYLELSADQKSVTRIAARGPGLIGHVKAVNASSRTLTLGTKQKEAVQDVTVTLDERAKILLSDGLSKGEPPVEGKLGELAEGTMVHVDLSVDRKRALGIRVQGESIHGYLKSFDTSTNTLIVSTKEEGGEVDKTFTAVKDAQMIDLLPGTPVIVRVSVFDKNKFAHAHGLKGQE
jgi:RNA polymerase sigma factor (sigma-70 family)